MFATAGSSIKLWDAHNYKQYQEITSVNGRVVDISWSQNGQCIAFLGESVPDISLFAVNAKSTANIGVLRGMDSPSCIQFPCRSSHYLGVGNKDGSVVLWNLKSKSRKKAFSASDSSISNIAFSYNDSHVAAASKGSICLLSLMNNSVGGPFKMFDNQVITSVAYSRVKKSLIGCCSDGGSVSLFDTHASKLINAFTGAHSAPVSSVVFSPINEILMISVGYDKKLICYNIQTKKQVLNHKSSEPLSSAAFLSDGQHIALGAMTGQVFIHDLRSVRMPLATLAAHDKAVASILLQPASKNISEGACKDVTTSKSKQKKNQEAVKITPSKSVATPPESVTPQTIPNSISTTPSMGVANPSQDMYKFFSPVRPSGEVQDVNHELCQQNMFGNVMDNALSPLQSESKDDFLTAPSNELVTDICEGIFSPVREASQNNEAVNNFHDVLSPVRTSSKNKTPLSELHDGSSPQLKGGMALPSDLIQIASKQLKITTCTEELQSGCIPFLHFDQKENTDPNTTAVTSTSHRKECKNISEQTPINDEKFMPKHILSPVQCPESSKCNAVHPSSRAVKNSEFEIPEFQISIPSACGTTNDVRNEINVSLAMDTPGENVEPTVKTHNIVRQSEEESETPAVHRGAADDKTASQLQVELIRNCMAEVLEDFQDDVNRRMMHLQYVVTKQFFQLKETMQNLQQQQSLNEELLQEVEQLRKDNARLRANF